MPQKFESPFFQASDFIGLWNRIQDEVGNETSLLVSEDFSAKLVVDIPNSDVVSTAAPEDSSYVDGVMVLNLRTQSIEQPTKLVLVGINGYPHIHGTIYGALSGVNLGAYSGIGHWYERVNADA